MFLLACNFMLLLSATSPTSAQQNGKLRLVGGESVNEGRVEVYYNRQWGTVCDDGWHFRDADVICKALGYERASQIYTRAHFGQGSGPIWIDELECSSSATSILECRHRGWGVHNCQHREDAGVQCKRIEPTKPSEMPVRLNCPSYTQSGTCVVCPNKQHPSPGDCTPRAAVQGIVEALYDDEWRPVSLDGWNDKSARIVCNELGYPIALGSPPTLDELWSNWHTLYCQDDSGGSGGGRISLCTQAEIEENDNFRARLNSTWLKKLDCTGTERRLLDCYFQEFGPNSNPTIQVATVRCGFRPHESCSVGQLPAVKETYRVRGGAVPWIGRLEVNISGEWGTVCDREFDMREANIACRGMGFGSAKWLQWGAFYGRGVGKVHYSALKCKGNETYLADCEHRPGYYCGHHGDISVECTVPQICGDTKRSKLIPVPDPTYFGYNNEFVEIKGPTGWGLLCAHSMNQNAASLVCRENKNLFLSEVRSAHHAAYNGTRYRGMIFCSDDDENIDDCLMIISKINSCPQGEVVIFCTSRLPDLVPDVAEFQKSLQYYPYLESRLIYYLTCALEEDCLASSASGKSYNHARRLLRFSSLTNNWGVADFQPILDRTQWIWHSCHNHYHSFEAFIHYDLLNKTTGAKVAEGHKASFCLEDSVCANGASRYRCSTGHQGISTNCGDLYGRHLDCQWIDVTDVPPGTYQLRQHVNPDKLSLESDYRNNIISCDITFYSGTYFTVGNFRLSDH